VARQAASTGHDPVLYQEIIQALQPRSGHRYIDGTLGAGGHAWGILQGSSPDGLLLGLDVDPQALELARVRLSEFGDRALLFQASYTSLALRLAEVNWQTVDGIVLDLGVSSMQLDTPERGFSFQVDVPLDMRFDPHNSVSAANLVNDLPEEQLAELIYRYGDETAARRIARAIVRSRPIKTTGKLSGLIVQAVGYPPRRRGSSQKSGQAHRASLHPATRTFQALRIAVNRELEALEAVLPQAVAALAPSGRLAVISFHSLEDRIVKQFFRQESQDCICPPRQPVCVCGHRASLRLVTRHIIQPQAAEIEQNPRSRSARLRVVEKLPV